ncbi:hypothetical protein [Marinobacter sp. X15-166B]|uniref:hypothetical protein n=1 Tax=Marinobacter sp. X15-166B TaxID=1897620 RepID=UPI00085C80BE|nr:hypothetical protein [Marinobacter sp. X15-166B]OEY66758.1 hypothetical protein BG841_10035 [Marinobacter sp. X15-166B]
MRLSNAILTLMIGPAVPVPAPLPVIEALQSVQVTSARERSGFQLTFAVGKKSALQLALLPAGYLDPIVTRVIIMVTLNGIPSVIMDGLVTRQELQPSNEPGQSTLTVTGEDLTVAMDIVDKVVPYPGMSDGAKVALVLAPYAALGIVPNIVPPIALITQNPANKIESQASITDLAFLKSLASRNGYVFYLEPGPLPGQNTAYFGPDISVPVPQQALSVNMDAHTNVESLSFSLDGLAKKISIFTVLDPVTKKIPIPVPVPNVSISKPPLGVRPTPPAKIELHNKGAQLQPEEAARDILSSLMNSSTAISGSGSLDVVHYGQLLRARTLVGVRGAGISYDGLYYVDSVTHKIKKGEYKQNFSLSRDGLISNTPVVMP